MRRQVLGVAFVAALAAATVGGAAQAYAKPSYTQPCNQCHGGTNVPVTATLVSTSGTNATYSVSAPGATYISVFNGSTKVTQITGASGQFSVATGKTYTVYAVKGPGTGSGIGSTSVSPVAAPADTTAPTTSSDAKASYVASATVKLTATDNTGGSGVANTYYRLDGGAQTAGTVVSVNAVGSHTLEFWSVDVAGNAEAHKTAAFAVTAPPVIDLVAPITISDAKASYLASATIKLTATDNTGGSGVATTYYRLDGGAQTAGTTISVATVGTHTIEFWSVDKAGNAEARSTVTFTVTAPPVVDTNAPTTSSDAKTSYVASATIKLTAADNTGGSGVANTYYRLDGGAQTAGTVITVNAVGSHTIEFWSVDKAGNAEAHKTASFTIAAPPVLDTTAPTTSSDAKASYVASATIKLTATDNVGVASTYYRLDGGAQTAGTTISVATAGAHTIEFWSVDAAGNIETRKTASFSVTAPQEGEQASTVTIQARQRINGRRTFRLFGALSPAAAGDRVALYVQAPGSTEWTRVGDAAVDTSTGAWSLPYRPSAAGSYSFQARFAGDGSRAGSVSTTLTLTLRSRYTRDSAEYRALRYESQRDRDDD